ncbi:hypothetical protein PILCRDRAFT_818678 [Piloderma croceum F 1598]|uniref:Uncharacterized protein n=1 Tax=Piloderma croceum (strain F 1598) TaxID=765440 RepID=A0A0C3G0W0_PILCF|nr:hypothetical protein PILCRDRAFT_818678 [Piloderma croceum F 1598]
MFRISDSDCGSTIVLEYASYARMFSFSLPGSRSVIACLVGPVNHCSRGGSDGFYSQCFSA